MDWERDGITRRSALARGFGGVALVCSFDFDKQRARRRRAHERVRARVGSRPVRALPARPADPGGRAAGRAQPKTLEQYVFTMRPGTADILPGLKTPVLGYDGLFPGPTIKATRGPRGRRPPAQPERPLAQRAPARRRHPAGVRRASARRDPERHRAALQVPERPAPGDALVPRPRARRDGQDAVRRAGRVLPARRSGRQAARAAARRLRRPADDPGPQLQRRRLLPLPGRPRPRLPRRHDPGQRRRRAADEGRAAALPAALPQRVQRARVHARRSATTAR